MPSVQSKHLASDPADLARSFFALQLPEDVAEMLEVPYRHLIYYLYRLGPRRYRTYEIAKRRGGTRSISEPVSGLKIVQQKLVQVLEAVYRPRPSVHGFVPGRSVATNAQVHEGAVELLNLDLADFFPSINFGRVWGLFQKVPYERPRSVATIIAQICTYDDFLPQGAPTSPIIANMICSRLDTQLQRFARRRRCVYTRYADDITISSRGRPLPRSVAHRDHTANPAVVVIADELKSIIEDNGFELNSAKVRMRSQTERMEVTGLIVNHQANVPRTYVRQIRAMLHAWDRYGHDQAQDEFLRQYDSKPRAPFTDDPVFSKVVKGKIDYLAMVRGKDDPLYLALLEEYARLEPTYDVRPVTLRGNNHLARFEDSIWVLECPRTFWQGTAFLLEGVGLVTCQHVLTPTTEAFHIKRPGVKYPVRVLTSDRDVDLAVLAFDGPKQFELVPYGGQRPRKGETVTVAGFPNYGPGSTLWSADGYVAGFRERMRRPRIQITCPIVAGASGSPVVDAYQRVVGVAGTGAETPEEAGRVADYGVIPISSLQYLPPIA